MGEKSTFVRIEHDVDNETLRTRRVTADVQRLDVEDYNLFGEQVEEPSPLAVCHLCGDVMTTEGIWYHALRIHKTRFPRTDSTNSRSNQELRALENVRQPEVEEEAELAVAFGAQLNVIFLFILPVLYTYGVDYAQWITTIFSFLFLYAVVGLLYIGGYSCQKSKRTNV